MNTSKIVKEQNDYSTKSLPKSSDIPEGEKTIIWFDNGYISLDPANKKFFYLIEAPPIKNIVFSGGGTRGILYNGVINAFEEFCGSTCDSNQNFISQIEAIAGASIGAVFAASLAVGIKSHELNEKLELDKLYYLLGEGFGPIKKNADPLYNLLKKTFPAIITKRLQEIISSYKRDIEIDHFLMERSPSLDEYHQLILKNLCVELKKTAPVITFSMLNLLHQLFPHVFKDLYIAVVCTETWESCYFSVESTPQLDIALACRASVAVPVFIESLPISKKMIKNYCNNPALKDVLHFVDGGCLDNIPFKAVENRQKKEYGFNTGDDKQNLQTLVILFDDSIAVSGHKKENNSSSSQNKKNYPQSPFLNVRSFSKHELAPPDKFDFFYNLVPKIIGGNKSTVSYTLEREKSFEQVRHLYAQRNIPLAAGFAGSDFEKANVCGFDSINDSKKDTLDYLTNHYNECIYKCYSSIDELLIKMPENLLDILMANKNTIPYLEEITVKDIKELRARIKNSFKYMYSEFEQFYKLIHINYNPKLIYFPTILKNFDIIRNDKHANDDEKMMRALCVALDWYAKFNANNDCKTLLHIFNKKFKKYIKNIPISEGTLIDYDAEHFCLENKARQIFYHEHLFYIKFQRIIFALDEIQSSFINPEDPFQRTFLETIKNDLRDIASFYLKEDDKLIRMENYLYQTYYKILFYQTHSNSALAQTLKNIIELPAGLRLSYKYGILLPTAVEKLPSFILKDTGSNYNVLQKKYLAKKDIFKRKIFTLLNETATKKTDIPNQFRALIKNIFGTSLDISTFSLLDEVKLHAIIITLLDSPDQIMKSTAEALHAFIVPADIIKYKQDYKYIFYAITLITHLSWMHDNILRKDIYENMNQSLQKLINNYTDENSARLQLSDLIKKYYQMQLDLPPPTCYFFFKQPDELLIKLKTLATTLQISLDTEHPCETPANRAK